VANFAAVARRQEISIDCCMAHSNAAGKYVAEHRLVIVPVSFSYAYLFFLFDCNFSFNCQICDETSCHVASLRAGLTLMIYWVGGHHG